MFPRILVCGTRGYFTDPRVWRPESDPIAKLPNLFVGQLLLWGHLQIGIGIGHRADQKAFVRLSGNDRRPCSPPFAQPFRVSGTSPPLALPDRGCGIRSNVPGTGDRCSR